MNSFARLGKNKRTEVSISNRQKRRAIATGLPGTAALANTALPPALRRCRRAASQLSRGRSDTGRKIRRPIRTEIRQSVAGRGSAASRLPSPIAAAGAAAATGSATGKAALAPSLIAALGALLTATAGAARCSVGKNHLAV